MSAICLRGLQLNFVEYHTYKVMYQIEKNYSDTTARESEHTYDAHLIV